MNFFFVQHHSCFGIFACTVNAALRSAINIILCTFRSGTSSMHNMCVLRAVSVSHMPVDTSFVVVRYEAGLELEVLTV